MVDQTAIFRPVATAGQNQGMRRWQVVALQVGFRTGEGQTCISAINYESDALLVHCTLSIGRRLHSICLDCIFGNKPSQFRVQSSQQIVGRLQLAQALRQVSQTPWGVLVLLVVD